MSVYTHVRCPVCGCRWDEHPDTVCAVYRPTLERPPDPASVRDAAAQPVRRRHGWDYPRPPGEESHA